MPRLIFLVPCRKAIIDKDDNILSIHEVIDGLTVNIPKRQELPSDAVTPTEWTVLTNWLRQPGDEGRQFEQRVIVNHPDGEVFIDSLSDFRMDTRTHRMRLNIRGFPIGQSGELDIRVFIRAALGNEEWMECGGYPIMVNHIQHEANA